MSETKDEAVVTEVVAEKEYTINILISDKNLSYKSDFNEAETIFWLEAVKDLILRRTFDTQDK